MDTSVQMVVGVAIFMSGFYLGFYVGQLKLVLNIFKEDIEQHKREKR